MPPRTRVSTWLSFGRKSLIYTLRECGGWGGVAYLNLEPAATYSTTAGTFPKRLNPFRNWLARIVDSEMFIGSLGGGISFPE